MPRSHRSTRSASSSSRSISPTARSRLPASARWARSRSRMRASAGAPAGMRGTRRARSPAARPMSRSPSRPALGIADGRLQSWALATSNWKEGQGGHVPTEFRKDLRVEVLDLTGTTRLAYVINAAWVSESQFLPELDANNLNTIESPPSPASMRAGRSRPDQGLPLHLPPHRLPDRLHDAQVRRCCHGLAAGPSAAELHNPAAACRRIAAEAGGSGA